MANTQLNNKVRNPKDLSKWLDIWNIDIVDNNNYTITPSSHWVFPSGGGSSDGSGSGGGSGDGGSSAIPTLSTTSGEVAIYEAEECLTLNQVIIDATLSWSGGSGSGSYSLSTVKDEIASYDIDECLTFGQALIDAILSTI